MNRPRRVHAVPNEVITFLLEHLPRDTETTVCLAAWLAAAGMALGIGGRLERTAAAIIGLSYTATLTHDAWSTLSLHQTFLIIDLVTLAAMVLLVRNDSHRWPLFIVAFELLLVLAHIAAMNNPETSQYTYLSAVAALTYGITAAMAVGAWTSWRARRAIRLTAGAAA